MARTILSDEQWTLVEPLLPGKSTDPGRTGSDNRMALEAILWIVRTGAPWRDLPQEFGRWGTAYLRFYRWAKTGVFDRIFDATSGDVDVSSVMVDGSFAKAHQHAAGARKKGDITPEESARKQAIGRSRGGRTTKIMALVDTTGRPVKFSLLPGNASESPELPNLLVGIDTGEVLADKAYDTDKIRASLAAEGIIATIPPKVNRRQKPWYDPLSYRRRHLVENLFVDMKQFRGVATRYAKLGECYQAIVHLIAWFTDTKPTRRTARTPVYKRPADSYHAEGQIQLAQG